MKESQIDILIQQLAELTDEVSELKAFLIAGKQKNEIKLDISELKETVNEYLNKNFEEILKSLVKNSNELNEFIFKKNEELVEKQKIQLEDFLKSVLSYLKLIKEVKENVIIKESPDNKIIVSNLSDIKSFLKDKVKNEINLDVVVNKLDDLIKEFKNKDNKNFDLEDFLKKLEKILKESRPSEVRILGGGGGSGIVGLKDLNGNQINPLTKDDLLPAKSLSHGSKSNIGTTAVQIATSSIPVKKGVLIKASNNNTGIVYVGNLNLTAGTNDQTDGFELEAGESVVIEIDDVNKLYARASSSGQKIFFIAV